MGEDREYAVVAYMVEDKDFWREIYSYSTRIKGHIANIGDTVGIAGSYYKVTDKIFEFSEFLDEIKIYLEESNYE